MVNGNQETQKLTTVYLHVRRATGLHKARGKRLVIKIPNTSIKSSITWRQLAGRRIPGLPTWILPPLGIRLTLGTRRINWRNVLNNSISVSLFVFKIMTKMHKEMIWVFLKNILSYLFCVFISLLFMFGKKQLWTSAWGKLQDRVT